MGSPKTAKRFGMRYPWEKWFKAGKFTLLKGVDFNCYPHGMAQMVRNKASALGVRVSVSIDDSGGVDRVIVDVVGRVTKKRGGR